MLVETLLRIAVGVSALGNPRGLPRSLTEALTSDLAPARFAKDFSKPLAVPEAGIEAAVRAMRSGRLFRYGASSAASSEVARAEREFADGVAGSRYAVGVNSGSSALMLGLMAVGVKPGDRVVCNGFAFTGVPSTIMRLGAEPVLVDTDAHFRLDVADLEAKLDAFPDARALVLSHTRGRVCDLDRVAALAEARKLDVVEDCGHAAGASWRGRPVGRLGAVAAFGARSDSMLNGGEAGFATTDDAETAAKLVYLSGCYERRYGKHGARPEDDDLLERAMATMPYLSTRMSELSAACLRPAVASLADRVVEANRRHALIARSLGDLAGGGVVLPESDPRASCVGDRLTFSVPALDEAANGFFRTTCVALGVPVAWLKSPANAFYHGNWRNYGAPTFELPGTDALLETAYDLALPAYFGDDDLRHVAEIVAYAYACAAASSEDDGGGA
jgi:dTDP-4-amino-4,6-dideoxygalactose transaminase